MKFAPNTIFIIGLILISTSSFGAEVPPPPPTGPTPPGLPIDSGVLVLMAVGLLLSFFKLKSHLKHKKNPI